MAKERRRSQRIKSNLFMQVEDNSPRRMKTRGVVVDVSASGFGIETEADLNLDETYLCHIEIPFAVRAKVVRRSTMGQMRRYGMMLIGNSLLDLWMLRKLIKKGIKQTKKVQL